MESNLLFVVIYIESNILSCRKAEGKLCLIITVLLWFFLDFLLKAISRYIFLGDNVWDDSCMFRKLLLHFS